MLAALSVFVSIDLVFPQTKVFLKMLDTESSLVVTDRRHRARRKATTKRSSTAARRAVKQPTEELDSIEIDDSASDSLEISDRRKTDRRRQIDPTTCERDYSGNEVEFMRAMDDYKRRSGRPFPTWSEVLEVLLSLGYRKVAEPTTMHWRTNGDS